MMGKILIAAGIILLIVGIFWPFFSKIPLFKIPGDIIIDKPDVKIFIPITSMIILSVVLSLIIWLVKKIF